MTYAYTINRRDNTATLDLEVAGVLETSYFYSNGFITLSERPNSALLTPENFRANLNQISEWIIEISSKLNPPRLPRDEFDESLDKKPTRVNAKFKHGNTTVTDAEYKFSTKKFDFKPRPEVTVNFVCFKNWYQFLEKFYEASV